jgi:hypothetical protein
MRDERERRDREERERRKRLISKRCEIRYVLSAALLRCSVVFIVFSLVSVRPYVQRLAKSLCRAYRVQSQCKVRYIQKSVSEVPVRFRVGSLLYGTTQVRNRAGTCQARDVRTDVRTDRRRRGLAHASMDEYCNAAARGQKAVRQGSAAGDVGAFLRRLAFCCSCSCEVDSSPPSSSLGASRSCSGLA